MTNKASHMILEISEFSTIEEAKKAYFKLFYKNQHNNEEMVKLNDAFNLFKNTLDEDRYLEIYEKRFQNTTKIEKKRDTSRIMAIIYKIIEFLSRMILCLRKKEIEKEECSVNIDAKFNQDFFEKLSNKFEITQPVKFLDSDFPRFYTFWNKFRMEDKECERKIRKIIKMIKDNDPRMKIINKTDTVKKGRPEIQVSHLSHQASSQIKKESQFKCVGCNKSFNSENTLKDHLKSKQHRNKHPESNIVEAVDLPKNRIQDKVKKNVEEVLPVIKKEECEDKIENKTKGDHLMFRTCGICKEVLDTRSDLIKHLRLMH